ncbi:hydroxyproline-rich glycoprotein family protein, putative [Medicago truncatula]|uniref:Hydroxyproline-rich glycoprotein family protein, putative n=1 Tax=Medicago truncatula TaxID=3880 RepID=G7KQM8_MEDTR|nr:hydroxyproline-rich glycoprotein family protein, putative [Medicago truncatula]
MEGEKKGQSVTVLMSGDEVPKFIAMLPCPCRHSQLEEIIVNIEKPPTKPR